MFATLFKRAEASVDNAIGDLGNRVVIAIPFIIALGFAAASLSHALERTYGPEIGNLLVAGAFCLLGLVVAVVVKIRSRSRVLPSGEAEGLDSATAAADDATAGHSIFDDETLMAVITSAAPIIIPAVLRTTMKNWPILLGAAASLYVFSRPETATGDVATTPPTSA
jgi:hypothetical protein